MVEVVYYPAEPQHLASQIVVSCHQEVTYDTTPRSTVTVDGSITLPFESIAFAMLSEAAILAIIMKTTESARWIPGQDLAVSQPLPAHQSLLSEV